MSEQDTEVVEEVVTEPTEEEVLAAVVDDGAEEEGEETPAEEFDEAEVEPEPGKKVKVKVTKGYKDWLLREDHFRHKTHGAGERERALDAKEQELHRRAEMQARYVDDLTEIKALTKQIDDYEKITSEQWIAWHQTDEKGAKDAKFALSELKEKREKLSSAIREKVNADVAQQTQRQKEWEAKNEQVLKSKIKDWSPEKETTIKTHVAQKFGFDPHELKDVKDPRIIAALDYIHAQDKALEAARARVAKLKADAQTQDYEPPPRVVGKSAPTGRLDGNLVKNNPAEFDRLFAAQRQKRMGG